MPSNAVQPCTRNCPQQCAAIAKVKRLQDEAAMASEAYKPFRERHVPGYTEVTDPDELAKLDLTPKRLNPDDSEFRAAVFRKNGTDDYSVVFKGTTSKADWMQNLAQGTTSRADYYTRAQAIGRDAVSNVGRGEVSSVKFIGHSLGGGLASAAAHATGAPATTFNSAGLHVMNRSWFNAPPIDAVRVKGELLTSVQSKVLIAPGGVGTPYNIDAPSTVASTASRVPSSWVDWVAPAYRRLKYAKAAIGRALDLHGMDSVEPALDEHRQRLEAKAEADGCRC